MTILSNNTGVESRDFAQSVASRMAAFAVNFSEHDLTAEALQSVGRALADTCAVGIAGCNEEASRFALRYARASAGPTPRGDRMARYWGTGEPLPLEFAALCNGVAAHALDYDDVTSVLRGHPSVAMLPALMALGEVLDSSGRDLALAYTVGFEVICKLSRTMALPHYAKGWHSTSTIGGLGCALACARLLQLTEKQTTHAIGLAVAQASGSRANFGTHAKSFQAGHANTQGLRASLLAAEGFEAASHSVEADFGYLSLYGHGESLARTFDGLGKGTLELEKEGLDVKKYPVCYATHRPLDGLLDLRLQHGLTLQQVRSIHVTTSTGALAPLIHSAPTTGNEGRFSLQYALAAALADGGVFLSSFTDAAVQRPGLQDFFSSITAEEANGGVMPRWAEVKVLLHDGRSLKQRVDVLRGSAQSPLSLDELFVKVQDCAASTSSMIDSRMFFDRAIGLERSSVRELVGALCTAI